MTIYVTSQWVQRSRDSYRWPCRTAYNPDYYSWHLIRCRVREITMPIKRPSTMPNLLRSYITENTIPTDILTQTGRSQASQLRWQLMTTDQLRNQHRFKPFQLIFPTKPYELSRRRSDDFQQRGLTVPELQSLPQTITIPEAQERSTGTTI